MQYQCLELPTQHGTFTLESYVPNVSEFVNPDVQRPAVVICPGGGYQHLSPREGEPVALRMIAAGLNAYVVSYRLAPNVSWPAPLMDLAAAVAWVRSHAAEHHTHPGKIAVMGFSAGGHLAASLGVCWHDPSLWQPLNLTSADVQPDAMLLCYPVITAGPYAHRGSFERITGTAELAAHQPLSIETRVTAQTPPAFLWHTWSDHAVPVENTLLMASALRAAGVSAEVHIYQHGSHGLALCDETTAWVKASDHLMPDNAGWIDLAIRFMKRL